MNTYRYCRRMNIRHHRSFTAVTNTNTERPAAKNSAHFWSHDFGVGQVLVLCSTHFNHIHTHTHTRTHVPWAVGTRTVNDVDVCVLCSVLCILIAIRVYRRESIRRRMICTITDQHSHNNNSSTAHGAHTHTTILGSVEFFFFVFFCCMNRSGTERPALVESCVHTMALCSRSVSDRISNE